MTGRGALDRGELSYRIYLAALILTVLLGPAVHALTVGLATPHLTAVMVRPDLPVLIAALGGLLAWVMVAVGASRGPVLPTPFDVYRIAGGPQPRRRSLRGYLARSLALLMGVGGVLGAVPPLSLLHLGHGGPTEVAAGALTGVGMALLLGLAWLAGQVWAASPRQRRWMVVAIAALTVAVGAALSLLPAGMADWSPVLLAVLALAALCGIPALLDRLSGPVLLEQSWRWQGATTAGGAGDLAAAAAAYRPHPRRPVPRSAIGAARTLPLLFLRRDLIGAVRTPVRSVLGVVTLLLAIGLIIWAVPSGGPWITIALAFGLGHLGMGVWSDGFRHTVQASAAPPLYGVSDEQLMALHALLPIVIVFTLGLGAGLIALVLSNLGAVGALSSGLWALPAVVPAIILAVAGLLFTIVVRAYDAAKPPMPVSVMTPIPSPMGDLSGMSIALWQADALLIAVVLPTAITALVLSAGWLGLLLYVPASVLLLLGARRRVAAI